MLAEVCPRWLCPPRGRLHLGAFLAAARTYWCSVHPRLRRELARWRALALQIPDPVLRGLALEALEKRSNMEGAAAFAAFVTARRRAAVIAAATAFQSAYNYLDLLAEQENAWGVLNAISLHSSLSAALRPPGPPGDWYRHLGRGEDGGYLAAMVGASGQAARALPSYAAVEGAALGAAERVVVFQGFNCGERQGDHRALRRWALARTPADSGLEWWETASAAGSSLGVFTMLAAAAEPGLQRPEIDALEHLCFPWVGALHSLLDQLIDVEEDERSGQRNFVCCYASAAQAADRIGRLAGEAIGRARLGRGRGEARHVLIVSAMAAMYLAAAQSRRPEAIAARRAVLRELGLHAQLAIAVFRLSGRGSRGDLVRAPTRAGLLAVRERPWPVQERPRPVLMAGLPVDASALVDG